MCRMEVQEVPFQSLTAVFLNRQVCVGVYREDQHVWIGVGVRIGSLPRGFEDSSNSQLPWCVWCWAWVGGLAPGLRGDTPLLHLPPT